GLEIKLTPGDGQASTFVGFGHSWGSSAQTTLFWSLLAQNKTVATGELTWPDSSNRVEEHADRLVRALEAGLERGCAPARLPASVTSRKQGAKDAATGVSPIDADAAGQSVVAQSLNVALDRLRPSACPDAR